MTDCTTVADVEAALLAAGCGSVKITRGRYGWTALALDRDAVAVDRTLEGALAGLVERVACWAPTLSMDGADMHPTEGDL